MVKKKRFTTNHSGRGTTRPSTEQGSTTSELGMNPSKNRNRGLPGTSRPRLWCEQLGEVCEHGGGDDDFGRLGQRSCEGADDMEGSRYDIVQVTLTCIADWYPCYPCQDRIS